MKRIVPTCALAAFAVMAGHSEAAVVNADIHDIVANQTQDYVFTQGSESVTLRAVFTPTNGGVAAGNFTSLDGGLRVGNDADGGVGAQNHFITGEGFDISVSLLSATAGVDTSTIDFRINSLGARLFAGPGAFDWSSSATALTNIAPGDVETDHTLDTTFYSGIDTTDYTGSFATTANHIQLSDTAGASGIELEATFVPEPGSLALLGLGGLMVARRRRG